MPIKTLYLDANASVPVSSVAREACASALLSIGNPSSPHALGRQARQVLDSARKNVAKALGATEGELIFTSGATEGNRYLVEALKKISVQRGRTIRVLTSNLEHPSVAKPLALAADQEYIEVSTVQVGSGGSFVVEEGILSEIDVFFVSSAHNETGICPDWSQLYEQLPESCLVFCDHAQAFGREGGAHPRVDAAVISGHKAGAVPGIGALMLRGNAHGLSAGWQGGGQEMGLRPGTESLPLIAAFGALCQDIKEIREKHQSLTTLRDMLEQGILKNRPGAFIVGQNAKRLPNTTAICFDGADGEALRIFIDQAQVCVGFGSACSSLAPEPSPSLLSLGLSEAQAKSCVRFSLSPENTAEEIEETIQRIKKIPL